MLFGTTLSEDSNKLHAITYMKKGRHHTFLGASALAFHSFDISYFPVQSKLQTMFCSEGEQKA